MNKLFTATLLAAAIIPTALFARQGADDMLEGGHRSSDHTGMTWSGKTWTGATHSGSMQNNMKGLHLAMAQLSPTDHAALIKIIQDYLISKGVDPAEYAEKREEIKEIKKEAHQEIKDIRKTGRDAAKVKREEMKAKIEASRGRGKANVQDISMTRSSGMGAGKATFKEFTVTK